MVFLHLLLETLISLFVNKKRKSIYGRLNTEEEEKGTSSKPVKRHRGWVLLPFEVTEHNGLDKNFIRDKNPSLILKYIEDKRGEDPFHQVWCLMDCSFSPAHRYDLLKNRTNHIDLVGTNPHKRSLKRNLPIPLVISLI